MPGALPGALGNLARSIARGNGAQTPDGVIARFEDGSTANGGVLIAADGIRSTVRELNDPAAPGPE